MKILYFDAKRASLYLHLFLVYISYFFDAAIFRLQLY